SRASPTLLRGLRHAAMLHQTGTPPKDRPRGGCQSVCFRVTRTLTPPGGRRTDVEAGRAGHTGELIEHRVDDPEALLVAGDDEVMEIIDLLERGREAGAIG